MKKYLILCFILFCKALQAQNMVNPNFTINLSAEVSTTLQKHIDSGESFKVAFNPTTTDTITKIEVAFDNNPEDWFAYEATKTYQMKGHQFIRFKITCAVKKADQAKSTNENQPKIYIVTFFANATIIGDDTLHNSNFFVGSFVKSIAGNSIPNNELLDLFLKLNFGKTKRFFSLMGVEAGLSAVTNQANSQPFRINEAMTNMNWAFFGGGKAINSLYKTGNNKKHKIKYWNDSLKRTGFLGAGLKIFNSQTYIGSHFGVMEINGPLLGSYFMAGFYITPYNTDSTLANARVAGINTFRNNVYIEAAVNAFGKNVPSFLKTIRLKFGIMMPVGKNMEGKTSNSGDVLSRLAVEVPLGGVFKF